MKYIVVKSMGYPTYTMLVDKADGVVRLYDTKFEAETTLNLSGKVGIVIEINEFRITTLFKPLLVVAMLLFIFLMTSCGRPIPAKDYARAFEFCGDENVAEIKIDNLADEEIDLGSYMVVTCSDGRVWAFERFVKRCKKTPQNTW